MNITEPLSRESRLDSTASRALKLRSRVCVSYKYSNQAAAFTNMQRQQNVAIRCMDIKNGVESLPALSVLSKPISISFTIVPERQQDELPLPTPGSRALAIKSQGYCTSTAMAKNYYLMKF